jgi:hypothetical protein
VRLAKIVWVLCRFLALAFYIWRRDVRDTDIVTIYAMMVLGFPVAWLSTMTLGWLFLVLTQHGDSPSGAVETLLIWVVSFALGYFQWFIGLPVLINRFRKR